MIFNARVYILKNMQTCFSLSTLYLCFFTLGEIVFLNTAVVLKDVKVHKSVTI